jgi:hypothetical protein
VTGLAVLAGAAVLAACSKPPLKPNGFVALSRVSPAAPARVVAVATVLGPSAPATTERVPSACPSGTTTAGGGIADTLIGGATPPSSLHADGSAPTSATGRAPARSGSVLSGWVAVGATGGQLVLGGATTSYAMCVHGTALGRPSVVAATVPGPAVAATTARATASCPAGELVVGGGGLAAVTKGSASPSLRVVGSFPSDAHGAAVKDSAGDPAAWSAIADAGGRTGTGVETSAFAVCVSAARAHTVVARRSTPGPLPASTATPTTAGCPGTAELLSGGADTGPASGATPQQGLHLTGSFPSDAKGIGPGSARVGKLVNSWTARAESGGQGSPAGTVTTAFALCLR